MPQTYLKSDLPKPSLLRYLRTPSFHFLISSQVRRIGAAMCEGAGRSIIAHGTASKVLKTARQMSMKLRKGCLNFVLLPGRCRGTFLPAFFFPLPLRFFPPPFLPPVPAFLAFGLTFR